MKVDKKTDGGGFFDFFTRKKTEIERVGTITLKKEKYLLRN